MTDPGRLVIPNPPSPAQIEAYHRRMVEALRALRSQYESVAEDPRSEFHGLSRVQFEQVLANLREELDQQVVLVTTASAEALIRQDYAARLCDLTKVAVHERFRRLNDRYAEKVALEDILDVWKEIAPAPNEAGALKQIYHRRHWLAHGRYWTDKKSGVQPDPRSVIRAIEAFVKTVQQSHPDFPRR